MTGAGGAGGSHGRRHRAGASADRGRSADRRIVGTSAGRQNGDLGVGGTDAGAPGTPSGGEHPVRAFFRANPQVLVLLVICLVLGLGTFIVVLLGLVTAGSVQTTGEPSGAILGAHISAARLLTTLFG